MSLSRQAGQVTPQEVSRSILQLSVTADDEMHLMLALIQYRETCRRNRQQCPPMVDQVVAQVSRRVTKGQAGSTFDQGLQTAKTEPMESSLISYSHGADLLACSLSTIKRRVKAGELEPVRISERGVRLRRRDVEDLIENGAN